MNIVIAGGGTAGWISAFYICKSQPGIHKITVVESSKIGIIGAGEGSTGSMIDLLSGHYFDYFIPIDRFLEQTDGTLKMGIRHENWSPSMDSYFAPLDFSLTAFTLDDIIFKYVLGKYGNKNTHLASKIGIEYENKIYDRPYAIHFDGHKVGEYFKKICIEDGVTIIDAEIKDVEIVEDEIGSLILSNNTKVEGDFFIDCTGFSRVLMKKLGVKWKSYSDVLSVNTAMPFILPYEENEEVLPETKATALSAGWMWNIPLTTRRGCGYVFNKEFITREEAQQEVEDFLQKKIDPIKWIEFDSGHSELFWKNNAICLGLSSSFVEPLEATSIHNTIIQLSIFVNECLEPSKEETIKVVKQDLYNERIVKLNELTIDFISLHYLGGRDDTPFWRSIQKESRYTENAKKIFDLANEGVPGMISLEGMYGSFSIPLANWILSGMDILDKNIALENLKKTNKYNIAKNLFEQYYQEVTSYNNES